MTSNIFLWSKNNIWLELVSKPLIWIRNDRQAKPCGMPDKRKVYFKSFFHKKTNWGGIQYIVSEKGDMKVDK